MEITILNTILGPLVKTTSRTNERHIKSTVSVANQEPLECTKPETIQRPLADTNQGHLMSTADTPSTNRFPIEGATPDTNPGCLENTSNTNQCSLTGSKQDMIKVPMDDTTSNRNQVLVEGSKADASARQLESTRPCTNQGLVGSTILHTNSRGLSEIATNSKQQNIIEEHMDMKVSNDNVHETPCRVERESCTVPGQTVQQNHEGNTVGTDIQNQQEECVDCEITMTGFKKRRVRENKRVEITYIDLTRESPRKSITCQMMNSETLQDELEKEPGMNLCVPDTTPAACSHEALGYDGSGESYKPIVVDEIAVSCIEAPSVSPYEKPRTTDESNIERPPSVSETEMFTESVHSENISTMKNIVSSTEEKESVNILIEESVTEDMQVLGQERVIGTIIPLRSNVFEPRPRRGERLQRNTVDLSTFQSPAFQPEVVINTKEFEHARDLFLTQPKCLSEYSSPSKEYQKHDKKEKRLRKDSMSHSFIRPVTRSYARLTRQYIENVVVKTERDQDLIYMYINPCEGEAGENERKKRSSRRGRHLRKIKVKEEKTDVTCDVRKSAEKTDVTCDVRKSAEKTDVTCDVRKSAEKTDVTCDIRKSVHSENVSTMRFKEIFSLRLMGKIFLRKV